MRLRARAAFLSGLLAAASAAGPGPAVSQESGELPRSCSAPEAGRAAVVGSVRDSHTDLPLPGARVLVWRASSSSDSVVSEARADSVGTFRLCGGTAGLEIGLRARVPAGSGSAAEVALPTAADVPLSRNLRVDAGRPGQVVGRVREASDGAPVSAATVRLPGLGVRTLTAEDGRFELPPLPPGSHGVRVEHVGHGVHADSLRVRSGRTVRLRLQVTPDPIRLAPLHVEVRDVRSMRLDRVGFYDRRTRGHGTFITREQLEEWDTSHLSEAFRRVQGFTLGGPEVRRSLHSNRDPRASVAAGPCRTQYFVNGEAQPLPNGIDTFLPDDIAAMEIYRGTAQLPVEFNRRSASCGAVVLWLRTRRGGGE